MLLFSTMWRGLRIDRKMKHEPTGAEGQTVRVCGLNCSQVQCQISVLELCKTYCNSDFPFFIKLVQVAFLSHAIRDS